MTLLRLRTWSVIALLVVMQTPAMLAGKNGPSPKKARVDRQIEQIGSAGGTSGIISVIVRSDGTQNWNTLLTALRREGVQVGRQARVARRGVGLR
jgi:hypothetical protein